MKRKLGKAIWLRKKGATDDQRLFVGTKKLDGPLSLSGAVHPVCRLSGSDDSALLHPLHRLFNDYHLCCLCHHPLEKRNGILSTFARVGARPRSCLCPAGGKPLEKIVERVLASQTDQWKQELKEHLATLEQEKDELLSWIHEMKTPLTAMRLIIERVGDENTKAQLLYEWLRIHLLLDQQLHQRRLPHMENDLYIEQVELEPLLINEIKPLQSWCMQKGIGFDLQLDVRSVLSDAKWLSFIIRQIITNAVKYSESSDIVVKSFMKNGHARLQIQDFGLGIDPKDLPRIFEKGFTSTTEHQNEAATGMGLYLAKKAAKPLLLDFHVESTPGRGTTFTIIFPQENDIIRTHRM
ncbi:Two-component sensor kinase ytsB [Geobacillus sp. WSUCF1]|nr:Two-component sensor kinase ytsB [Geobacillus sp. WSUCF1]